MQLPKELVGLAEATGGEVIVCNGLQHTLANVKAFVHRNIVPSLIVYLLNETNDQNKYAMVYNIYKKTAIISFITFINF